MACEERNRLLKELEIARANIAPYPMSTDGVPQSFGDVLHAEQLQRTLHERSAALAEHDRTHACAAAAAK